jgi:hypothetical protein
VTELLSKQGKEGQRKMKKKERMMEKIKKEVIKRPS